MAQCHAGEPLAEAAVRGQIGQVSRNGQNTRANGVAVRASKLTAQKKSDTSNQQIVPASSWKGSRVVRPKILIYVLG